MDEYIVCIRTCTSRSLKRWQIEGKICFFFVSSWLNISLTGHFVCATTSRTTITATTMTTHDNNNNFKYTPTSNKFTAESQGVQSISKHNEWKWQNVRALFTNFLLAPTKCNDPMLELSISFEFFLLLFLDANEWLCVSVVFFGWAFKCFIIYFFPKYLEKRSPAIRQQCRNATMQKTIFCTFDSVMREKTLWQSTPKKTFFFVMHN